MSLISVVIILALVGFGLWALKRLAFIDPLFKNIITVVVVIVVVIWLLQLAGLMPDFGAIRVGK